MSSSVHGPGPDRPSLPAAVPVAVTALSVVGFLMHTGPVYRGGAAQILAAQPVATWVGAGSLALLLAGLLALAAGDPGRSQRRELVAVLSVLGTLAVAVGLIDPPAGAGRGWALIVIAVLAVLQTALALFAALPRVRAPRQSQPVHHFPTEAAEPPAGRVSYAPPTFAHTPPPSGFGMGTGVGTADHQARYTAPPWVEAPHDEAPQAEPPRAVAPADRPTGPVFTPQPSPAATGAQPARAVTATPSGAWGGQAQPATGRGGADTGHSPAGFTPGPQ
jgi:hypothetical protein